MQRMELWKAIAGLLGQQRSLDSLAVSRRRRISSCKRRMLLKQKSSTSLGMSRWLEDGGVRPQTWGDASPSTPASPMEIPWSAWTYDDERLALNLKGSILGARLRSGIARG
jgi:hypothetical protein